jgi:hypothetical protein
MAMPLGKSFAEKLKKLAMRDGLDAPMTLEKKFWQDVAAFALNPFQPKEWPQTNPEPRLPPAEFLIVRSPTKIPASYHGTEV